MRKRIRPLFKYPGAKYYLCKWIISNFPKDYESMYFFDVCGGAGNIILNKNPSLVDFYNEIDPVLYNVFYYIKFFKEEVLEEILKIECNEGDFEIYKSQLFTKIPFVNKATVAKIIAQKIALHRMSRNGAGKSFSKSKRLRGGQPEHINSWKTFQQEVPTILDRIKQINIITNMDFELLIRSYNSCYCFFYIDPPYLPKTRKSKKLYNYEMSEKDHERLLNVVTQCKGKVLLSGYPNPLYQDRLKNWNREGKYVKNNMSHKYLKDSKIEILWKNY